MTSFSIKKDSFYSFLALVGAIAYGFFVVEYLYGLYRSGSGDINELVYFFEDFGSWVFVNEAAYSGDFVFRWLTFFMAESLEVDFLTVLGYIAFLTSSASFYLVSVNLRSRQENTLLLILLFLVFFSPAVVNLYASSIRSGIAFTILLIGSAYPSLIIRWFMFALAIACHLSMAPLVFFIFIFNILQSRKIAASYHSSLIILAVSSVILVGFSYFYRYNITLVNSSLMYNLLVVLFALVVLFSSYNSVNNKYGFMAVGLVLIVITGFVVDLSFSRYLGSSIILYLLFLAKEGSARSTRYFTFGFLPYFILTSFYSVSNQL